MQTLQNMEIIRDKWSKGIPTINVWLSFNNPFSAEVMSYAGFDTLTIDMQHGLSDYNTLISSMQAIRGSHTPIFTRVPWLEAGIIMKALDLGVNGIICPMINCKEDALNLVKWSKYPPQGQRSFGPTRAKFLWKENYFNIANEEILIFAMIETREGIENLDSILSVDGISGVYIGPGDLSASLGLTPQYDKDTGVLIENTSYILQKAREYNKLAGIHTLSPGYASKMGKLGFNFMTLGQDAMYMLDAAKNAVAKHKELSEN